MSADPIRELTPAELCRTCNPDALDFDTTADLEPLTETAGQPRVEAALEFGAEMTRDGYNIFAFGPPGTGKHKTVKDALRQRAAALPTPPDLCYVNNFEDPRKPRLLVLPPAAGAALCEEMKHLVEELANSLRAAFEGDEYQNRRQLLEEELKERQEEAITSLGEEAKGEGLALLRTPMGIIFAPMGEDDVITPEEFEALKAADKKRLEKTIENFQTRLQKMFRQFPRWQREARQDVRDLNREVSQFAVGPLIEELKEKYAVLQDVLDYLDAVEKDVLENAHGFIARSNDQPQGVLKGLTEGKDGEHSFVRRYQVNVLVDNGATTGAPVVFEDNPTFINLIGSIEHVQQMGALTTDFNLIKAGALHRANGGYLLVEAIKLLSSPFAWDALKRALQSRRLGIESPGQAWGLLSTYSPEPEPVDLTLKVVLLGPPLIYYLLAAHDPDFPKLFKVPADFSERMDYSDTNLEMYARLIARIIADEELRPCDKHAVARLVEHGSRRLGDSEKISLYSRHLSDVLREADYFAGKAESPVVGIEHVQAAIDAKIRRSDRIRERMQEEIVRGTVFVDTSGEAVGQINGLSVLQLGDFAFGRPSRITARVRLGKGEVIDIEREVELSGPIHSKGVLILAGFLGARYAANVPLALSATLVFEQSYGGIDGDSASSAELYALMSAISGVPLRQDLAVTGSVNQHGFIQPIGGANEKIEGFFDLCSARGLSGTQGVLIPASNVKHLMLRHDVVAAVKAGTFHVYPVETIDRGIELLTGMAAGERRAEGDYPDASINALVERRLNELAEKAKAFSAKGG
ncbi:MAG: AAA family ATPase [Acidobacteriota bacterium]|nr:AAA family ATPase [Acidobacteriota bacterium]